MARFGRPIVSRLALAIVIGAGTAGAAIGLMATSAWLIARAAERPPVLYLMVAVTGVRAFGIARGVLRYAERLAAHDAAFRVLAEVRASVYDALERLAPAGLRAFRSGDLIARVVADVDSLADVWLRIALPYASAGLAVAGAVAIVGGLVPAAGVALATAVLVAAVGAPLIGLSASRAADRAVGPIRGELASGALELLGAAAEIQVAGTAHRALEGMALIGDRFTQAERRSAWGVGVAALVAGLAAGAGVWAAIACGIDAVSTGALGGVGLAVVALTPLAANEIVASLGTSAVHLPGLASAAARVDAILDRPSPVEEPITPLTPPSGPCGLRIRNLRLRYPDAPEGEAELLGGLDLDIVPGSRTLVTGPSGSGKSSLAAALLRFLEPSSGSIELVGSTGATNLATLAGRDVRRVIGLCEQDPHVFDSTIGENLRLARPDADAERLRAALGAAHLLAWIDTLPDGLDTPVGEHAARLSGGQRQRLAVARAILADVPIIVLDEPTEHVDEAMATALVDDLVAATAGRTVLVLTHRPELMRSIAWDRTIRLPRPGGAESLFACDQIRSGGGRVADRQHVERRLARSEPQDA